MNDLIWIGNALYPRWVIFTAVAAIPIGILIIDIAISIVQLVREVRK